MNKKGTIKKVIDTTLNIISYICFIILFIVASFLLFYIISSNVSRSKHQYPPVSLYTIVSPSMEPNINVYDVIVDTAVKDENTLKVGDIITFYTDAYDTGGYTVTHRIKDIVMVNNERRYITKGDNNQVEDKGYTTFKDIVGRVNFIIPKLGYIQMFISSKLGWMCIILIPALGIILMDIVKLIKVFKIRNQIEKIPKIKEVEEIREKEEDKKVRALIEKANNYNNNSR